MTYTNIYCTCYLNITKNFYLKKISDGSILALATGTCLKNGNIFYGWQFTFMFCFHSSGRNQLDVIHTPPSPNYLEASCNPLNPTPP